MTIEERLGLDTHPRPVYSGPEFHQAFLKFVSAHTLRTQYQTLENLLLAASRVVIDDKTFSSIHRQSKRYFYVSLASAIGINHLLRRTLPAASDSPGQLYKLDTVFLRTPRATQPTTVTYETGGDSSLVLVRASNAQLPLFIRSTELDEPFDQMSAHTPMLRTAQELRHYVSQQALNGFVAVRGSVVDASQPHLSQQTHTALIRSHSSMHY